MTPARAALALVALGLGAACYETAPRRVQVVSAARDTACVPVIESVFLRSGFVRMVTPPELSMLFRARLAGPRDFSLVVGMGIGVIFVRDDGGAACRFDLEVLSTDPDCPDDRLRCGASAFDPGPAMSDLRGPGPGQLSGACGPRQALTCPLTPVRGKDYDAALDEMARRLRLALGAPEGAR